MGKVNKNLNSLESTDNFNLMRRTNSPTQSLSPSTSSNKCCTKENFLKYCRKFIRFLISRIGLMIVMIGYVLAGGLIFEAIESGDEKKALKASENALEETLNKIYKQIESNSTRVKDDSFYFFLRNEIRTFGEHFTNATLSGTMTIEKQWDYFGSVFYCVTLVSTIGYGHITCKTIYGKMFTIIYSSIGIPLMMLFMANIGSSTATVVRFIYQKINSIKRGLRNRKLNNQIKKAAWQNFEIEDTLKEQLEENVKSLEQNTIKFEEKTANQELKYENESKNNKKPKVKNKKTKLNTNDTVSVSIGIRNVDIPKELIQTLINPCVGNKIASVKKSDSTPKVERTNLPDTKEQTANPIFQIDHRDKELEALKKIDKLIELDNNSLNSEDEEFSLKSDDNFMHGSQMSFKKLSSNTLNETNKNENYLISNIFKKSSNTSQEIGDTKKTSNTPSGIQNKGFKSSSLNENHIRKNAEKNSKVKINTSQSELVLNKATEQNKSPKKLELPPGPSTKPSQFINQTPIFNSLSITNMHFQDKFDKTSSLHRKSKTLNDKDNLLLDKKFRKTLHQSVKFKPNQVPFYNAKQLSLIYKQYKQEQKDKAGVPMVYTLLILVLYLICGMSIFSRFENWKKLDALYFCFVTLTTIGFGDLMPGSSLLNKNGNKNSLYISALYIFGGLILIAMCINLAKREFKLKVKYIARKIGLGNN